MSSLLARQGAQDKSGAGQAALVPHGRGGYTHIAAQQAAAQSDGLAAPDATGQQLVGRNRGSE